MNEIVSLPESDYQTILEIIDKLYSCESVTEVKQIFENDILTLIQAQSGLFAWLERDIADCQIIQGINMSDTDVHLTTHFLPYNKLSLMASSSNRPVVAYGVDRDRNELNDEIEVMLVEHPDLLDNENYINRISGAIVAIDRPEPNLGVGIHRLKPCMEPFTLREVRIMELLRPHIIKAIRFVVLKEEFHKYKSITESLTNSTSAFALVNECMHVLFLNAAFQNLFSLQAGQLLQEPFSAFVKQKISQYRPDPADMTSAGDLPFYNSGKETFWMTLIPVTCPDTLDEPRWLIKLKPVMEQHSRSALEMEQCRLTHREMEICWLVKDGFDEKEIAARLFVSPHTVNTHIKNIYRKFGVHSRAELVIALNR